MLGFGRKGHGKRHDIGSSKDHKGDIYDALVNALHALTAANVAVDTQTLNDAISAAIVGMDWQSTIIRFEAMVTNEPVAPGDGDRFISTEAGAIPSTSQAVLVDDVCQWDNGTSLWIVTTPDDGWAVQETGVDPNIAWWYSGAAWRKLGTMVDHNNLLNVTANQHHNELHDIDSTSVHNGVGGAVINEMVKFDTDGLPALSGLKHVFVSRAVPETGLDYIEIGKFTQAQGSFAIIVAVSSIDSTPSSSGSDLYYIVGSYDETAAAWQLAYPIQTHEPHSQLCVMIDDDELHLRLIAITSTLTPVTVKVQILDMGVGNAIFTAASGTGTMGLPGTTFPSTLISQVGGVIHMHAEMSMNTEKITDVVDPVAAQGVATKNYVDVTHGGNADVHHLEDTIARQSSGYYVSDAVGSDGYTGTEKRPFKSGNAAIAASRLAGNFTHRLFFDNRGFGNYTLDLVANEWVTAEGYQGLGNITIAQHDSTFLWVKGMSVTITEGAAQSSISNATISHGALNEVQGPGGVGNPTNTRLYLHGCSISTGSGNLMTHLANTDFTDGYSVDTNTNLTLIWSETDLRSNKIINLLDPTAAQDGATKNYVDITPALIHGISDNARHSGALVNDNIALGDANGLVKDSGVAISSILGGLIYQGTWDASTNTPALADGTGTKGHYYRVSVAGSQDLGSGLIAFAVEDFVAHNGAIWQKIDHTDQVTSVFTRQGAVVAAGGDYTASQVTNVPNGDVASVTVQAAIDELDSEKVAEALYDAQTILRATIDDTPTALTVAEQRLVGRITAGNIEALTVAQVLTLLGIDLVNKKSGVVASGAFGAGNPRTSAVVFNTAMPDDNYSIAITGADSRVWSIDSKTANGFTINTNSAVAITGNTFWIARVHNDP